MKAIVKAEFTDKDSKENYPVGATVDFDVERIKSLAYRQLVKVIEVEPKAEPEAKPKRVTKKK